MSPACTSTSCAETSLPVTVRPSNVYEPWRLLFRPIRRPGSSVGGGVSMLAICPEMHIRQSSRSTVRLRRQQAIVVIRGMSSKTNFKPRSDLPSNERCQRPLATRAMLPFGQSVFTLIPTSPRSPGFIIPCLGIRPKAEAPHTCSLSLSSCFLSCRALSTETQQGGWSSDGAPWWTPAAAGA